MSDLKTDEAVHKVTKLPNDRSNTNNCKLRVLQGGTGKFAKRCAKKETNGFFLFHDNASCHKSHLIHEFWANNSFFCLSMSLFNLFFKAIWLLAHPKNKKSTKRKMFWHHFWHWVGHDRATEIHSKQAFQKTFHSWIQRWDKCITG